MNSYLITIDPPEEIIDIVERYRKKYMQYTNYKIPPHITIYPPFYLKQISEDGIFKSLKDNLRKIKPIDMDFSSINYFEGDNNIAFFAPDISSAKSIKEIFIAVINSLCDQTEDVYDDYKLSASEFNPHMTIAERVPNDKFETIKKELSEVKEKLSFGVEFVYLYKQEEKSSSWNKIGKVNLTVF